MTAAIFATGTPVDFAIDFELDSNQYLRLSDANWGSYNRDKWSISMWIKPESLSQARNHLCGKGGSGGVSNEEFQLDVAPDGTLRLEVFETSSGVEGRLQTLSGVIAVGSYTHILVHYDLANVTADDRMKFWVNGSAPAIDSRVNPDTSFNTTTSPVEVGNYQSTSGNSFDGRIFQWAFFNNVLVDINDVYNAGDYLSVRGISGLKSLLNAPNKNVTRDDILGVNWTNIGGATPSSDKP